MNKNQIKGLVLAGLAMCLFPIGFIHVDQYPNIVGALAMTGFLLLGVGSIFIANQEPSN